MAKTTKGTAVSRARRHASAPRGRSATVVRTTKETDIRLVLDLDGAGRYQISTGIAFLDHMLELFARHGFFDLTVEAKGDLHVDYHHTVEDVGLVLGQALKEALAEKAGIRRFGEATVPLDEALVQTVVDLSGRPFFVYDVDHQAAEDRPVRRRADPRLLAGAGEPGGHEPPRPHVVGTQPRTTSSRRRSGPGACARRRRTARRAAGGRALDQGHPHGVTDA